jgi:hypothetical protein
MVIFRESGDQLGNLVRITVCHAQGPAHVPDHGPAFIVPKVVIWATLSTPYFAET